MIAVAAVTVVAPDALADPGRPSGGNSYDRRVCQELAAAGWTVDLELVPGGWPQVDPESRLHLAAVLASVPGDRVALLDGLVALAAPEVVVPASSRLRLVVLVHVADTGVGVPSDKVEAIFEPFVQVKSGFDRGDGGVGLGLAISRDLARAMGGDITVKSAPGAGSTFTLSLPIAERSPRHRS